MSLLTQRFSIPSGSSWLSYYSLSYAVSSSGVFYVLSILSLCSLKSSTNFLALGSLGSENQEKKKTYAIPVINKISAVIIANTSRNLLSLS